MNEFRSRKRTCEPFTWPKCHVDSLIASLIDLHLVVRSLGAKHLGSPLENASRQPGAWYPCG